MHDDPCLPVTEFPAVPFSFFSIEQLYADDHCRNLDRQQE